MEDPSVSNKGTRLQINDLSEKLSNLLTATQNTTLALFSPQAIFPESTILCPCTGFKVGDS